MFIKTILTRIVVLGAILQLSACSTLGYIAHTSSGHLKLMRDRQAISDLLSNADLEHAQITKFNNLLKIREFASDELLLPNNKSYTSYVELDRDYVTWVVFAAPTLSLKAEKWCFWIVGCVPYRGYFSEAKANQFAEQVKQQHLEVYVAPVPAYSTLGWFSDPLLSSMVDRGELVAAEYIFHELAHQQLYIKNDTSFNEAYATAVGQLGVIAWLESENKTDELKRYLKSKQEKQKIYHIVGEFRQQLMKIYQSEKSDEEKLHLKQQAFLSYKQHMTTKLKQWDKYEHYRPWLLENINNAKLNAFSTYQALVPEFISLFKACDSRFDEFYRVVASTRRLNKQQRLAFLQNGQCVAGNSQQ